MKVSARVKDEWLQIPCKDGTNTVRWLGEEAWRKYQKLMQGVKIEEHDIINVIQEVRKTRGGALLDPDDIISEVLDNDDFVNIVLTTDTQVNVGVIPEELKHVLEPIPSNFLPADNYVFVDGSNLTTEMLVNLGNGEFKIKLSKEAINSVLKSRSLVESLLGEERSVYGITTGIGSFSEVSIPYDKLEDLQYNIIRSHAAGVGNPLSPARTRMLLALRINVLAKGYSGISLNTLQGLVDAFNASCLSWVPEQGSVGASGDLAPLAHLALGIVGEGKMWSPKTGWGEAKRVLKLNGLKPLVLGPKEADALVNGTQLITSIGAEAVERALHIAKQADVVAALTLEVLKGTSRAFDSDVQKIRPHKGQIAVAKRLRALLHSDTYPSEIAESHRFCNKVQDAYTLRCCPQVHGIVHDTIDFVQGIIQTEMNSGTDNPLVFADRGEIISAGNFHGEYPAKVLDFLSIAVHELASMSEKRIERLVNPALSSLPAYLVKDGGLNSGFMVAHCTAAALVSENKVVCHPSSVDSMSTSAGQEDHVSMGCFAARKALQVIENVENVIAIELLAACQAIEFLRPLRTTTPLEEVYATVRSVVQPWDKDRFMAPDIEAVKKLLVENKIWNTVQHYMMFYHAPQEQETRVFSPTASSLGPERAKPRSSGRISLKRKSFAQEAEF
ncbi:histidine ammonia-lyase isoform X2 [Tribolium castaneum]|uniref:Histidine ammonia-lyase n=1 Tax=Tribolium castaneum TaxID=7070 RepID=A0A139WEG3_TRICA|nr:PREDICTED: histidine ammonia-lyase isoform X2 [Tribolium castaneum]KYB26333.1 Histidine ammonia-lyase-like Protein [Tribolium castaneum]|eukprot:XP_008196029.1 PREDICTED: histidine ammonia-lyase isoform X2 [Tribolium castaneum]